MSCRRESKLPVERSELLGGTTLKKGNNEQSLLLASFHRVSSDTMQITYGLRREGMVKLIVGRARYPPVDQSPWSGRLHGSEPD
ncbi:hypothetical protein CGRA01v4_05451 [Colletotrichum graminicola]|nr:hypothetical protein CGRA01v4_05451 [Colletotrichum graminicola]